MKIKKLFPDTVILKSKHFIIEQDWECPIPAFFILKPKRKARSVLDFNEGEAAEFMDLLRALRKGMRDVLGIKDVYLFQNEDTEWNFHMWVFPRLPWMKRFGNGIESVSPIMEYSERYMAKRDKIKEVDIAAEKIRRYMKNAYGGSNGRKND